MKNPVARNMNAFNKPSVIAHTKRKLQSEATLRDAREDTLNELECSQTKGFDGYSVDLWVLDEMSEIICDGNACLGDIGSSNILIDDCEED